ncbi:hypothetical protein I601_1736 [Nocardioides dokdonensis FR1436]|uniref:DUF6318 domain-containing protein n=1 Tax=Nocardioides dokdonensis FR1436 TaxID=1300347 RepID=A0A1A9GIN6_9ACTN|nr:DUF6318 family protein [Nocardioides dokdonensis]ANH38167.1 hypothetical protein I601_1736 [Nocardioides dokdonensis FR1436]
MRRHLAYAAALLLALTACSGDDPEPKVADPTPSASPSPSESAAPAKEEWEKKTDDGAVAFVEHWVDVFNKARSGGDTEELSRLSSPDCETCSNFMKLIDQIYGAGGSVETKGWRVAQFGEPLNSPAAESVLPISVDQAPQILRKTADSKPQRNSGGRAGFIAFIAWNSGRWQMTRLDITE